MLRSQLYKSLSIILSVIALTLIHKESYSQLIVANNLTPEQLVQNILVGSGITVSNVTFSGTNTQRGTFINGSTTNLGIDEGVVLGSGGILSIPQPAGNQASISCGSSGDPDLNSLAGQVTFDGSILQFDFIPQSDSLSFRYVFGSEEYPEYVCSSFNDVFGFFISGPGINGPYSNNAINIARIPESMPPLPVAINSVNNGIVGQYGSSANCISLAYSGLYVDNLGVGGTTIVYDGFTRTLTAIIVLQACEEYHIKLAIADAVDRIYDSGVFLEANSFSSPGVSTNVGFSNSSNQFGASVEGCNDAILSFELQEPRGTDYEIVIAEILGTATLNVDYAMFPPVDTIIIPAGETYTELVISPYPDNLIEGMEVAQFIFEYAEGCSNANDTTNIYIEDNTLGVIGLMADTTYCISTSPDTLIGYPPGGTFTGPGITDSIFYPAVAGAGTHTIMYEYEIEEVTPFGLVVICSSSTTLDIDVVDVPESNAGPDDVAAEGFDYTVNASSAKYYSSLSWTTSGTGVFDDPGLLHTTYTPSAGDAAAGFVNLSLVANAITPCFGDSTDFMVLTIASGTTAIAGQDDEICEGDTYQLLGNGLFFDSKLWETSGDGSFDNDTLMYPIYTPGSGDIANGSVIITLTVYGSSVDSDEMVLTIIPAPVSNTGVNANVNEGDSYTSTATAQNSSSHEWLTEGDGSFNDPIILNAVYNPGSNDNLAGSVILYLISFGTGNCTPDTNTLILNIISGTSSNAGSDVTICANENIQLNGTGQFVYTSIWQTAGDGSFNDTNISDAIYYPGSQDIQDSIVMLTFIVQGSDTVSNTMMLYIHPLPEEPLSVLSSDNDFCSGSLSSITLTSQGGYGDYLKWFEGSCGNTEIATGSPANIAPPVQTTTYYVWWENMCGVTSCLPLTIDVEPNVDVEVLLDASGNPIESGDQVVFTATETNGGGSPEYTFLVDGTVVQTGPNNVFTTTTLSDGEVVSVELLSSERCTNNNPGTDEILMGVVFKPTLTAPTAFTPDGDNLNDLFILKGPVDEIAQYSLKIYDRWGALIYKTENLVEGWDGKINGKAAPAGVYVWMADFTIKNSAVTSDNKSNTLKGSFVLIK